MRPLTSPVGSAQASTSSSPAPELLSSSRNARLAIRQRSREARMDRIIGRLENKLYGRSPTLESEAKQAVIERVLEDSYKRKQRLEDLDLKKPDVAVRRLVAHSKELGVDPSLLAFIAELNGQMLLLQPLELRARVMLLESALQLNNEQEVLELAKKHPNLLTKRSQDLAKNLPNLAALFKSRGMDLRDMARKQPELLLQAPGTLKNKMDALPAALDLPPRRARDVLVRCPELLRRSTTAVHERFKLLQQIFDSVPRNYLSELICQDPRVLCVSSDTMAAKFKLLMAKYGSFQADVVDMILVDPNILLKAQTASSQLQQQQQQQQQQLEAAPKARRIPRRVRKHREELSGTGKLLNLASELQIPLSKVLQLCSSTSDISSWTAADVNARLGAIAMALGLTLSEARAVVRQQAGLLEVPPEVLRQRADRLIGLLRIPARGGGESGGRKLLTQHPELLTQDSVEMDERFEKLAVQLNLPSARVTNLVESFPSLVLEPSDSVGERLEAIRKLLGGVSEGLIAELVAKEPRILSTPLSELGDTYEELASSFGSFREDALQLVLADPSMLLKGSTSASGFGAMDRGEEVEQEKEAAVRRKKGNKDKKAKKDSALSSMDNNIKPLSSVDEVPGQDSLSIEEALGLEMGGKRQRSRTSEKKDGGVAATTTSGRKGGRYLKK